VVAKSRFSQQAKTKKAGGVNPNITAPPPPSIPKPLAPDSKGVEETKAEAKAEKDEKSKFGENQKGTGSSSSTAPSAPKEETNKGPEFQYALALRTYGETTYQAQCIIF
jgi:hypothetical protein